MEIGPIESKRKLVAEVWTGNKEPKLCLDPPVEKEIKELPQAASSKGKTKTWCSEMTDDELLHSLDEYGEFEISTDVIQKIRDYSAQLAESGGFEIDVWPGSFMGVSDIAPVELSKEDNPSDYDAYESLAKFAIDEYNKDHEKKFDFEQLQRVTVRLMIHANFYLTFTARSRDQDATHETFRAKMVVNVLNGVDDRKLCFCMPKSYYDA